ncbi:MAG: methylenetetrahydrofolate--tRNA-(uracil(54)-C(5))-methyltransferase (FADH(2)-oxidizing) TrmFO, partial [Anaerolineales bacterium]|nr:methylenetetrahydrofolate--tRNA-(uracil(54)-C(5))-methyltransferase (FADH(2)-oxidizing) TrmFO [Anaerolineales bacterium]
MKFEHPDLIVVGGGLAGSEAAWQAASRGLRVHLYEMRPQVPTGAHQTSYLAELVCSNSLGSTQLDRAQGLLKEELRLLGSFLLKCAEENSVPAGGALAVDRQAFAHSVTAQIEAHPNIEIIRQEITQIPPTPAILASGPLTSPALSTAIASLTGQEHLYFFDAIAPIVSAESIDMSRAYKASRYNQGDNLEGDYINCPMTREAYLAFAQELVNAERIALREFENDVQSGVIAGMQHFFEGCLPVEIIAQRGIDSLAYGPLRPVGLKDPHTGKRPYAVVQLRQDNLAGSLYNLVGFQTNLTFSEQQRVFRLIPGLEHAIFERYGQMHRNTFIFSPAVLRPTLQHLQRQDL